MTIPIAGSDSWFFILGCQRSGTTLMRLILECHSRIDCADERLSYEMLCGRSVPVRRRPLLGLKVPCVTEQFGEATLSDIALLPPSPNPYRGQPLLFLVRDVRDAIVSMRALRIGGHRWIDAWMKPTLRAKITRDTVFRARYGADLRALDSAGHPELAQAALYWRYKVEAVYDYLGRGFPTLPIRYEDLVTAPAFELLRVCGFLRIPWEPALLAHATHAHGELDDRGMAIGETAPDRAIDARSIGQWRGTFTDEEVDEILRFAGPAQTQFYPGTVGAQPTAREAVA